LSAYLHTQETVFNLLNAETRGSRLARSVNGALALLIVFNVVGVMLETIEPFHERFDQFLATFESISLTVFSVEYALRVWSCVQDPRYRGSVPGRLRFVLSPMALIDLAAIAPMYLPWELTVDFRFGRIVRLVRMVRFLKIARYSRTLQTFGNVLRARRTDLGLIGLFLIVLLVVTSSLMYFAEHNAQPEVFSSIPAAMWWGVSTLTTVSYGDIYPVTPFGKFLGSLIALVGVGFFALPAGILAGAFAEELAKRRGAITKCPHCGGAIS